MAIKFARSRNCQILILNFVGALILSLPVAGTCQQPEKANSTIFDPLKALTDSFPKTVTLKNANTVLEFCPDGTCDGFVSSPGTTTNTLKDFAYLYEYFFSQYIYLPDWRNQPDTKSVANRVLSKAEYGNCKNASPVEAARCVLLGIARKGSVRLIFIRYDERARGVIPEDIIKELEKR